MLNRLYSSQSFILVGLAIAWQAGIFLESLLHISSFVLLGCIGITFLCIVLLYRDFSGRTAMLLILCLFAGAWRYSSMLPENDTQAISTFISPATVSIQGMVVEEPKLEGRTRVLIVEAATLSRDGRTNWMQVRGKVEVQILGNEVEDSYGANYGNSVELRGKLQLPSPPYTPPGIFTRMMFPRVHVTSDTGNVRSSSINFFYHLRSTFATLILQVLPQPAASLLVAIVLGLRTPGLTPLKFAFNVTGTAHLIVPSGFKVTILAGLVTSSTRWLYRIRLPGRAVRRKSQQWQHWAIMTLILISIAAYTILSGAGPAAIRAGIMGSLLVLAPRIGRNYNVYTALALSSALMSGIDPFVLWDTGFQLSFLGTLGIVLLTPYFQSWLRTLKTLPLGHTICEMIAVTLAAQVATLPIFATTFQQISFIAPLANLLTVPLLGIFIALGAVICGVGLISLPLAQICGWVAWPLLTYVINCILWCAALPGAYLSVTDINSGLAWAYYALLAYGMSIILRRWSRDQEEAQRHSSTVGMSKRIRQIIQWSAACLCIGATGIAILGPHGVGQLSITFLDVGPAGQPAQGEAIFIRTAENKTVLIDGGMDATSLGQALDSRLAYWQRSLDMVILTTPRSDHLGGLQDVVTRYQIGSIRDAGMLHPNTTYTRWRRSISERALPYAPMNDGETIPIGTDVALQVLWPKGDMHKGSNEVRDNALIIRLTTPGLRVLLLGSAAQSRYALVGLAEQLPSNTLPSEIVQIIGEKNKEPLPELKAILQKVQPAVVIVTPEELSAAQKKMPSSTDEMLQQFAFTGMQVIRTEQAGSVEVTSSSAEWTILQSPGSESRA